MTLASLVLGLALQAALLAGLAPTVPVGDEREYSLPGPVPGGAWIRVPLHRALIRAAMRLAPARPFNAARLFVTLQSLAALGLCVFHAETQRGTLPAMLAALILLACLERGILAVHLWPDIAMGLLWLLAALAMAPGGTAAPALALLGGLALGLRIEGAALCLVAVLVPLVQTGPAPAALNAALCAGFALAYTAWNRLLHGRWVLDSTTAFNLDVLRISTAAPGNSVAETMRSALRGDSARPAAGANAHLGALAARVRALLGPETFVSQALLQTGAPKYAGGWRPDRALAALNLRYWFTLCTALTLALAPFATPAHVALLALASLTYAALLVRSRYRMALLPLMALVCAEGAAGAIAAPQALPVAIGAAWVGFLALILRVAPRTDEVRQTP